MEKSYKRAPTTVDEFNSQVPMIIRNFEPLLSNGRALVLYSSSVGSIPTSGSIRNASVAGSIPVWPSNEFCPGLHSIT